MIKVREWTPEMSPTLVTPRALGPLHRAEARMSEIAEDAGEEGIVGRGRNYSFRGYSMDTDMDLGTSHFAPMKTHNVCICLYRLYCHALSE